MNFTRINIAFTGGLFSSTTTNVNLQLFSQNFKCVKQDFSVLIRIYISVYDTVCMTNKQNVQLASVCCLSFHPECTTARNLRINSVEGWRSETGIMGYLDGALFALLLFGLWERWHPELVLFLLLVLSRWWCIFSWRSLEKNTTGICRRIIKTDMKVVHVPMHW